MGRKPRISPENRGKVLALTNEKYSKREVAHQVGCSPRSVSDILKKKQRLSGCVRDRKILGQKEEQRQKKTESS